MRGGALKDMDRVVGRRCGAQDTFQHSFAAAQSVALGQPPHAEEARLAKKNEYFPGSDLTVGTFSESDLRFFSTQDRTYGKKRVQSRT
jgi:hypothetical protein